jgi:hypothetical protein
MCLARKVYCTLTRGSSLVGSAAMGVGQRS